jgi:tetratricopeptide (TPR) repeat protein
MHAQDPPEPPEEDPGLKTQEYDLNPIQAKKEFTAGNFYLKKGSYRAAALRYREASRWDPGFTEAFLKWGESAEKQKDYANAREAFTKYFELSEDPKLVAEIKKRMEKWPANPAPPKGPEVKMAPTGIPIPAPRTTTTRRRY